MEFVPAIYNFNALIFFIDHGFNRGRKMMPIAKKITPVANRKFQNTDFDYFLETFYSHRLQTGAKQQHRQTKPPTY